MVTAIVVPARDRQPVTLETLRDAVREQLPAYCAPRRVVFADDLPRSTLGKLLRTELDAAAD